MTKIPLLFAGIVVLVLCVRLIVQMLRSDPRIVSADDFAKARESLASMLIKTATIKRILSDEDLNFVSRSGSDELRTLFLKERRVLVVHWFRTIQKQVAYLMDIHLRLAATGAPRPESELKLSLQYALFMGITSCLIVIFWLFGPFNARRTLAYVLPTVEGFTERFRQRLEGISPAQLHPRRESLVH
jgi:hypothetical protein